MCNLNKSSIDIIDHDNNSKAAKLVGDIATNFKQQHPWFVENNPLNNFRSLPVFMAPHAISFNHLIKVFMGNNINTNKFKFKFRSTQELLDNNADNIGECYDDMYRRGNINNFNYILDLEFDIKYIEEYNNDTFEANEINDVLESIEESENKLLKKKNKKKSRIKKTDDFDEKICQKKMPD